MGTSSVVLAFPDKMVAWVVCGCSVLLIPKLINTIRVMPSPAFQMSVSTLFFSSSASTRSLLFHTEVGALQGGGLSLLPSLGQRWGLGTVLLAKALVCLCLLAFLV